MGLQGGRPPAEIVVDQSEVRQDHYLRVTLRSTKPFKGFLLRAEDAQEKRNEFGSWSAVGTWYIPYQNISETSPTSAKYLHCGGAPQSAVTHGGANSGAFVVSFQVKICPSLPLLDRSISPVATTCRPGGPCEDPGHSCGGLPHLLDRHPCPRRQRGRQAGGPCSTDPVCEQ